MAGYSNNMSRLLNKIENRLGTKPLNLPDELKKEKWADNVIIPDTLTTFSRFIPYQFKYMVDQNHPKKNGYYLLDEDMIGGAEILGIRDLSWQDFGTDSMTLQQSAGYGIYDFLSANYGMDDIGLLQMRADSMSLFNNGIYPEFIPPNKLRLSSATNRDVGCALRKFHVLLLVKHSQNLTTISPTQMETFDALAQADIANYLYKQLKYYDNVETVYATIDLKIQDLETEASKREEIVNYIRDNYVSAGNQNQPIMLCE